MVENAENAAPKKERKPLSAEVKAKLAENCKKATEARRAKAAAKKAEAPAQA